MAEGEKTSTIRGQTVRWIGARFCVCLFLDSIDKLLNIKNVKFVGTIVVPRIPQHANITSCTGFFICKWNSKK